MATTTALPHFKAIRQEAQVITQTVVLPSTTYTTYVTLGVDATDRPVVTSHHSNPNGLSDKEIGIIVGTVVGVFIILMIAIRCCLRSGRVNDIHFVPPGRRMPHSKRCSYGSSYMEDGYSEAMGEIRRGKTPQPQQQQWTHQPTPQTYWTQIPQEYWTQQAPQEYWNYQPPPPPPPPKSHKTPKKRKNQPVYGEGTWVRTIPVPTTNLQFPPPVIDREQVPGGPKIPTYKANPIPNPNKPQNPPRRVA
ncbi:hypothetical protein BHE90_005055 [Fusarium euwallaceae]|uniref:Mid2 domain-containing protein n=4 Tax=Fusarium solani species complex TaxID=232080 RepID=A0A3M2SN45_9HYPO|nr:hypothetical protein CDV36_001347 [Fusarium kuroshium]RSL85862.1 hypothetical protein CEP51_003115 [Fusarium floridanum]RSM13142.1 hypothetical protein CEP52_002031 [Fusarium oligoseptatum]RTE80449.1 hypothetical protein BHE90_005055 [Fusarium euwallaceae]